MSANKTYNWSRFWTPLGRRPSVSDEGFLYDPDDADFGVTVNPEARRLDALESIPCLGLLGEPGSGKTTAVKNAASSHEYSLYVPLGAYSTDSLLHKAIFESREFQNWLVGDYDLYLYLDGLDESLAHVRSVALLLATEFEKYPRSKLFLRIACRSASWPELLTEKLSQLWGASNFGLYELAPLRRQDVVTAAEDNGFDGAAFLESIAKSDVTAFATIPITLEFLLSQFGQSGEVSNSRIELYEAGCLRLCEESSVSRRAAQDFGELDPVERLEVAELLAALTIFTKWPTIAATRASIDSVFTPELLGGIKIPLKSRELEANHIFEVLGGTALFDGPEEGLTWKHWTFAEFLAARFVVTRELTSAQIQSLIMLSDSAGRDRVVPQLRETAAWIASMRSDVRRLVAQNDPQSLLNSAMVTAGYEDKSLVVQTLLELLDQGAITDRDLEIRYRYEHLAHPNLLDQLVPYLTEKNHDVDARRVALDIAEGAGLDDAASYIANIALDPSEICFLRASAARAVGQLDDEEAKNRMDALLDLSEAEDPDDELKGAALTALARSLPPKRLFECLTKPRRFSLFGKYRRFLSADLDTLLSKTNLPEALSWVAALSVDHDYDLERIVAKVLRAAWHHLDDPSVIQPFARAAVHQLEQHDAITGNRSHRQQPLQPLSTDIRRDLLTLMAPLMVESGSSAYGLMHAQPPNITPDDLSWSLSMARSAPDEKLKGFWCDVARIAFDQSLEHIEIVCSGLESDEVTKIAFGEMFAPIELGSDQERELKKIHSFQFRRRDEELEDEPDYEDVVGKDLAAFEEGELNAWWWLNLRLTLAPARKGYSYEHEWYSDLTKLRGWPKLSDPTRVRVLSAARKYVQEGDPSTSEWLGTNTMHRPAVAGLRALRLIIEHYPEYESEISDTIWAKWTPIVLSHSEYSDTEEERAFLKELCSKAYSHAPDSFLETLNVLIDKENSDQQTLFILRKLEACWDKRLASFVLEKARTDESLSPSSIGELLESSITHNESAARDLALGLFEDTSQPESIRLEAGEVLIAHQTAETWESVWNAVTSDIEFGKKLFLKVSARFDAERRTFGRRLPEESVGELYVYLAEQFPHAEDPQHDGAHWVGPRETVAQFRDGLLSYLGDAGTSEALKALRRIQTHFPSLDWLRFHVILAERSFLRENWQGVAPKDLLELSSRSDRRIVTSSSQLAEAVVASLDRLQARLVGETSSIADVWNDDGTPTKEWHLSDYIKRHLEDDLIGRGIILSRETEVRRGEEADIYVSAVTNDVAGDTIRIPMIIEVKGNWNDGLKTDMEDQLKDRYLKDNNCDQGLYVVGWFASAKWLESGDYRSARVPKWSLDQAKEFFATQAAELSDSQSQIGSYVLDLSYN